MNLSTVPPCRKTTSLRTEKSSFKSAAQATAWAASDEAQQELTAIGEQVFRGYDLTAVNTQVIALFDADHQQVSQLAADSAGFVALSETQLMNIRNFCQKSVDEVRDKLTEMGLSLKDSVPGFDGAHFPMRTTTQGSGQVMVVPKTRPSP